MDEYTKWLKHFYNVGMLNEKGLKEYIKIILEENLNYKEMGIRLDLKVKP